MTEWRVVPGFESYIVSEFGDFKRAVKGDNGRIGPLKTRTNIDGYFTCTMVRSEDRKAVTLFAHKAVALAFLGEPPTSKHVVAHNDGSRTNNHWSNLRWATAKENQADRWKHGTRQWGGRSHFAKLTSEGIEDIRERYSAGNISIRKLARIHGVSNLTIANAIKYKSWQPPFEFQALTQEAMVRILADIDAGTVQ